MAPKDKIETDFYPRPERKARGPDARIVRARRDDFTEGSYIIRRERTEAERSLKTMAPPSLSFALRFARAISAVARSGAREIDRTGPPVLDRPFRPPGAQVGSACLSLSALDKSNRWLFIPFAMALRQPRTDYRPNAQRDERIDRVALALETGPPDALHGGCRHMVRRR